MWLTLFVAALAAWPAAVASSQTVEVDLIFPRNGTTYDATEAVFPFIFAIQNVKASPSLLLTLDYNVFPAGDYSGNHTALTGSRDWQSIDAVNGSDPYFISDFSKALNATDDTSANWELRWTLAWSNCTASDDVQRVAISGGSKLQTIRFSTAKSGGQRIDLAAATADGTCDESASAVALAIEEMLDNPFPDRYHGKSQCPRLSNATAKADPCKVKIDQALASNITATLANKACHAGPNPPEKCPGDPKGSLATHGGGIGAGTWMLLLTGFVVVGLGW
ncbi:hypothetical protein MY4824_007810 [Beauveria thailandica]